ncbi:MAG: hypothetical protein JWQ88_2384, partial [Rhodoferax sp.]|nr:hypothetical protein [Rhodoferax sp.]
MLSAFRGPGALAYAALHESTDGKTLHCIGSLRPAALANVQVSLARLATLSTGVVETAPLPPGSKDDEWAELLLVPVRHARQPWAVLVLANHHRFTGPQQTWIAMFASVLACAAHSLCQ